MRKRSSEKQLKMVSRSTNRYIYVEKKRYQKGLLVLQGVLCFLPLAAKMGGFVVCLSSNKMESQQYDISIFINNGNTAAETPAQRS